MDGESYFSVKGYRKPEIYVSIGFYTEECPGPGIVSATPVYNVHHTSSTSDHQIKFCNIFGKFMPAVSSKIA